jgi:hypothetical protein
VCNAQPIQAAQAPACIACPRDDLLIRRCDPGGRLEPLI